MIICAGESEQFEFAIPIGIGLTEIAIQLTLLCKDKKPSSLLFVGTAGSYGGKKIFDIIESQTATIVENSFFNSESYSPIKDIEISFSNDVSRETIINSSHYITRDKNLGKYYLSKNIGLENMEYYAVLKVAKVFNIPAKGLFIVTNYCDENAHKDFLSNHKEAMKRLTKHIKEKNNE